MAYCTNAELTAITGTTLATATQDAIIAQSDRDIKARIGAAGLTPPATDDDLKAASLNLSTAGLITYNRMNTELTRRTQTKSVKFGDVTIADDPDEAIKALTDKAWLSVDAYITSEGGASGTAEERLAEAKADLAEAEVATAEDATVAAAAIAEEVAEADTAEAKADTAEAEATVAAGTTTTDIAEAASEADIAAAKATVAEAEATTAADATVAAAAIAKEVAEAAIATAEATIAAAEAARASAAVPLPRSTTG